MKVSIQNGPEFNIREGETLLSALGRAGVAVSAPCGGKQRCGKCQVKILRGTVRDTRSPDAKKEVLPEHTVLACCSVPETDIVLAPLSENAYEAGAHEKITGKNLKPVRAGVALDIGTTTVSARLVDLDSGGELDTYSALNRQRVFGADVMSRIGAAREGKTKELFEIINRQTAEILSGFKTKFGLDSIEILTVAANTTMLHLFANEDPSPMGEIPFKPVFLEEREYSGADIGLPVEKVFLFPSISAFLGGDVVSGLGTIGILEAKETAFFIDIGTNGEMALFHNGELFCASAAAGPALEGAEISCGVGSVRGAVNKVELVDGKLIWGTIANEAPVGICGCGLIDAMALMLDKGVIDEMGAFTDDDMETFTIAPGISLTNRDVRQYQLAKSAILSAIGILCARAGIAPGDVKKVFVAGGLGFYIDQKSAVRTGLLPPEFLGRIEVSGNTSLKGAINAVTDMSDRGLSNQGLSGRNKRFRDYCGEIIRAARVMDLASDPAFMDAFAENMIFPLQD